MTAPVYLRQNAVVEPLYRQWYAWPYLVSPMTSPLYVENLHVKLMESFAANPQVHAAAARNPGMAGGPFLALDESHVPAVSQLLETTRRECAPLLEFARGVRELTRILATRKDGAPLQELYGAVPEPLRGYVELVYDVDHQPSIRFLEPLLYRSPCYDETAQSIELSVVERDDRTFVFSTPRLEEDGRIRVRVPYRDGGLDRVLAMRDHPRPLDEAREALAVGRDDVRFEALFTDRPPRPAPPRVEGGVRIRYFGHACVLVETADTAILTDPVVAYDHGNGMARWSFADLPGRIDYVLITHGHQDHCMLETLLQLRPRIGTVVVARNGGGSLADPSLKLVLEKSGFASVCELDELGRIDVADGSITSLPFFGEHGDLNIRAKTTYLVRLVGRTLLFCADSNALEPRLYEHLRDVVGDLDIAFLGMECDGAPMSWLYGPLLTSPLSRRMDHSRRLDASDCERGMDLIRALAPKAVYVYAMGAEPWLTYLTSIQYTDASRPIVQSRELVARCREIGICAEALFGTKQVELG